MHRASSWIALRTLLVAAAMVLATLALRPVAASARPAGPPQPPPSVPGGGAGAKIAYQGFELANGLRVYVIEDHKAPLVHEVLWFKVGSKDEVARRTGFAHLFEHLMFKGSAHVPDGLLDQLMESAGGWSNAFTDRDMTVYQNVAASNFLEQMLWIEADRLAGLLATFDQSKLDNQRDVVLNERRQSYENQPYGMAELLVSEALWPAQHGYHWSTIGYPRDLQAAQVADVSAFFQTYYVPNNATMVIAGDVSFAEVKRLVEKYFGWMPRAAEPVRPRYAEPAPLTKEVVLHATDDVQVPKVFLTWRGPRAFSADEPALDLAMAILGEGKSSRLYKRLVYDEKIAQDVAAGMAEGELGSEVQIEVTAKPGIDAQRLIKEISEEVAKLAAAPPDALTLERAKSLYEASFLGGLEATLQRAIELARYDVMAGDPDFFAKDLARYRAVTAAQVREVAARYLRPSSRVTLTIAPGKKAAENVDAAVAPAASEAPSGRPRKPAAIARSFPGSPLADWRKPPAPTAEPSFTPPVAQSRTLSNGMTLLVIENHQLPLAALTLLAPGAGSTADPPGKLGLAAFSADLLDEGAADLTPLAIAEEQDRLGAEIHAFADADSAGVVMRTLEKTLDPTIELLAKILTRPRFDAKELERVRGDRLTALAQRRDRPREVANLMLAGELYGPHSRYGHPVAGYSESLRAITLEDVRGFYARRWDPAKMTVVVAGDVTAAAVAAKLERAFAGWKAAPPPPAGKPTSLSSSEAGELNKAFGVAPARLLVADRPGAAQSDVRVGLVGPARSDPRYFAFEVLRTTLGDGFTSRLTQRLREQLGITYSIGAGMDWRREPGTFSIGSALVTPATAQGLREILAIVRDLGRRDVPRAELEKSKQNMIRALPAELETNLAITGAFSTLVELGLPRDWYAHYAAGVRKVTAAQVRQAAKALLPESKLIISLVGDLAKIEAGLAELSLGAPRLHDAYGQRLPAPAPASSAAPAAAPN